MRLNFVLFALGAWLLQRQAELPPLAAVWMATAVLGLTAAACVAAPSRWRYAARLLSAMAWLAAGFAWAATLADIRLADRLPQVWEGRDVRVIGVIATLPQMLEHGMRFALDVEEVVTPGAQVPAHIGLSWWGAARERPQIRAGERWAFTVRLKRPHGMVNPHGYDYEAWLLEHGIRATGYVRGTGAERLAAMVHRPIYWVEAARGALRDRILNALEGRQYAGVLAALAVGDQRAVPAEQWQTFTRTGVNHLMRIK
ncbi:MAG: ComEC/Rec2 family competence protein [Rhodospirillaceae bacterium]